MVAINAIIDKINHMAYINIQDVLYFMQSKHLIILKYLDDLKFFVFNII